MTDAVSESAGKDAAALAVPGRWYASVAVVNKRMFAVVLEHDDELGFDTRVDKRTGMTTVRVFFTSDALPDKDGVVETVRNRARQFVGAA